jgi:hypothetical protein
MKRAIAAAMEGVKMGPPLAGAQVSAPSMRTYILLKSPSRPIQKIQCTCARERYLVEWKGSWISDSCLASSGRFIITTGRRFSFVSCSFTSRPLRRGIRMILK